MSVSNETLSTSKRRVCVYETLSIYVQRDIRSYGSGIVLHWPIVFWLHLRWNLEESVRLTNNAVWKITRLHIRDKAPRGSSRTVTTSHLPVSQTLQYQ
uniref:Uncharacterized protein n=1 Tax=Steinernema glaseri TaxID=37863 RepID=A0A1I7Z0N9_9BILA